jgi:hypothetical protein
MRQPLTRRLWLSAAVGAFSLSGCGFALKGPPQLGVQTVALQGFAPQSEMAAALRRALPRDVRVVASPAQAELLISARDDRFEQRFVVEKPSLQIFGICRIGASAIGVVHLRIPLQSPMQFFVLPTHGWSIPCDG